MNINLLYSACKPLFDRFTQDPKLFIYEYVDMSVIGFLIGYTQDNQITKGTRTAALYAYSDVIYVLKPKKKYACNLGCGEFGGTYLICCSSSPGNECRYPGAVCGYVDVSYVRTLYLGGCN